MAIRFRFRAIPFVATVLLVALGISLGQWQQRRVVEKLTQQALLDERGAGAPLQIGAGQVALDAIQYRPVTVTGQFLPQWAVYAENRPLTGRTGFYVLMPLRIANTGMHVLVVRGWLPRHSAERARIMPYATPSGQVTVTGIARAGIARVHQLGEPPPVTPGAIVQNVTVAEFAKGSGLAMQPFVIEQTAPASADDKLERSWPAPSLDVNKNKGYAFQWYALAVMALLFFLITGFKRGKNDKPSE